VDANEPTRTVPPDATNDPSEAALDAGLIAAFGGNDTHPYQLTEPVGGTVIAGRYKLSERVGEGGMGSVWVAHQTEPVKRKVAVKLIKAGMDSKAVLARFEAERQALAVMDHPNIAKVLDGGLHDGRPYFVMELVKGVPITQFCDERKLTPAQRLELFVPVCQAIQHAHQKGVIHRDIKPSNVLVALYDDRPVPKVIDFGIAKATGGTLTDKTIETAFGGVVGTPQYMSPEQASLNNLDIDTRSDVYSLGVLLYELLTGSPPFARKELEKRGLLEILRVVREEEPPRPSHKLSTADALPSLSASRGTEPKKLTGLLRNELDWIVMKALEKDRTRRYETANGFAADVLRYLSGEPVQAHPPSAGYRVRKFVRRHKGQVIAGAAVAAALLVGIVGFAWQARVAQRERDTAVIAREAEAEERKKAETARAEAQAKEAEANAVIKFFEDHVFAAGRPKNQDGGLGSGVSLRDAILAGLPALGQGLTDQPLVEARLRQTLGNTFWYLGEAERAAEQAEQARALFTRHRGLDHPDTLSSMHSLGNSYYDLGRRADALKLREETLAARKRVLGPEHPDTLSSMVSSAISYGGMGRHADALKLREETLAAHKRVLGPDDPRTLMCMHNLANSYVDVGRPVEALKLREETLAVRKRVLPADHPDLLKSMGNIGSSYYALGRRAEALKLFEQTLAVRKRVLPADHPDTLLNMGNLANCYRKVGRFADALKLYEETLAAKKRVLPTDHPDTLTSMNALAFGYESLGRHADALKLREETLAAQRRVLPADHPDTIFSMAVVAVSLFELDRGAEAIPLIDECVMRAVGKSVDPAMHLQVLNLRGRHFEKAGDPAGMRVTAEMWEKLNRTDAQSLYVAGCIRAVTSGVQAKTPGADAARLAKEDADKAMQWLHKAVQAGYKNVAYFKEDTDLDALRDRDDFKKLLADLEAKFPPMKETLPPPRADK
jgi:tetratricopeptide (TPR) repeat protein